MSGVLNKFNEFNPKEYVGVWRGKNDYVLDTFINSQLIG
jgi:hypothetical protein